MSVQIVLIILFYFFYLFWHIFAIEYECTIVVGERNEQNRSYVIQTAVPFTGE